MNDKIDSLIAQLKTEIENYVQTEVAARSETNVSLAGVAPEPSSVVIPDFSAPASEVASTENSIGGKPMGESGIEAAPVEVAVPPMPTPTSLTDSNLSIPAPDFSMPVNNDLNLSNNLGVANSPNPVLDSTPAPTPVSDSNPASDFQMPTFINSETTNNSSSPDAFNVPVTDLPLPGSSNSSASANNVSVDEALSNLPDFNNFSHNQGPQVDQNIQEVNQNEPVAQDEQIASPSPVSDFSPATPTYDISEVTPKDSTNAVFAQNNETSDLPQPNLPSMTNDSGSTDSGFSKAKGLLSRVLKKEWGKK